MEKGKMNLNARAYVVSEVKTLYCGGGGCLKTMSRQAGFLLPEPDADELQVFCRDRDV
jgi:hypothetical protein